MTARKEKQKLVFPMRDENSIMYYYAHRKFNESYYSRTYINDLIKILDKCKRPEKVNWKKEGF